MADVGGRFTFGDSIAVERGRKFRGVVPIKLNVVDNEKMSRFENGNPNTGLSKLLKRLG